jgi:hypothetical protein
MTKVSNTVWVWRALYAAVVAGFLLTVASYYDRTTGLTIFLGLPANGHSYELTVVQAVPHAHDEVDSGYDGQFYAQMAVDPLLRDPNIDRAMDNPGYRAHRILFSWTAWLLSRGDPETALHLFAWQNVILWFVLAWLMTKWCPPGDARMFVLWVGVLLTHGLLMSVRNALSDGPSVVVTALAVLSMERGRPWLAAVITGISGLARETNILAGAMWLQRLTRHPRSWIVVGAGLLVCLVPLVVWLDYLRSIYLDAAFSGGSHITTPLSGLAWKVRTTWGALQAQGLTVQTTANVWMLVAFLSQAVALIWCTRQWWRDRTAPATWLLVAWPFLLLGLTAHRVVWDGSPGAITRVVLPLTVGVNVLLARQPRAPWALLIAANLGVICGVMAFVYGWI